MPANDKTNSTQSPGAANPFFVPGIVLLAGATGAAAVLAVGDLAGMHPPGCGPASACAAVKHIEILGLKAGFIPGIGWPVSFAGTAFFGALLVGWLCCAQGTNAAIRWAARFGALVSLFYLGVMIVNGALCPWCIGSHLCNLAFVIGLEATARETGRAGAAPTAAFGAAAVALLLIIGVTDGVLAKRVNEQAQDDRDASLDKIIGNATRTGDRNGSDNDTTTTTDPTPTGVAQQPSGGAPETPADPPPVVDNRPPFTGRYLLGPKESALRVVVFSDYQCDLCKAVEQILLPMATRGEISLSVKHFPMCTMCNDSVPKNLHPNACFAAVAAEAAGLMGGNDAFWAMHKALFDAEGLFEDGNDLNAIVNAAGLDPDQFNPYMKDEHVPNIELIKGDIDEALALGLEQTPTIFINGVELRGVQMASQVAVELRKLQDADLPPASAANDKPPLAKDKFVAVWRNNPKREIPADTRSWSLGADDPLIDIVLWGDYREPGTGTLDAHIRADLLSAYPDARYTYRHYPFDQKCNEHMPRTVFENGCQAAKIAEAAGTLNGADGYWAMHEWLFDKQKVGLSGFVVRSAGRRAGLDGPALIEAAEDPALEAHIIEDIDAAKAIGLKSIPFLWINGRQVTRWKVLDESILPEIIDEARRELRATN